MPAYFALPLHILVPYERGINYYLAPITFIDREV